MHDHFSFFPIDGYFLFTALFTFAFSAGVPDCATRDRAFRACASSSIGYFRLSGSANAFAGSAFRLAPVSFAMYHLARKIIWPIIANPYDARSQTFGYGCLRRAYCSEVSFRYTPPKPFSMANSSACLASRLPSASPRRASSLILSAWAKLSLVGNGVFKSVSRN
jgi:hypothetical protein